MDKVDATGGDIMDIKPAYVDYGHSGQLLRLSYTEEVGGSSPSSPTLEPSYMAVFYLISLYVGDISIFTDIGVH